MELTQIVITISLILVTLILVITGIWLIRLLADLRLTVAKVTDILDDTKTISSSIAKPVSSVSEFVMGFKNGFSVFNSFMNRKTKKHVLPEE